MTVRAANFSELKIDSLSRAFGSLTVVKEVNLTIKQGGFTALLGLSGCGQSTTLNILAGLLPATWRRDLAGRGDLGPHPPT